MHFYGNLHVSCVAKGCSSSATFENTDALPPYQIQRLAIAAGWYIAMEGDDLCPKHHAEKAAKHKLKTLYAEVQYASLPTPYTEEKKKAKRTKDAQMLPSL